MSGAAYYNEHDPKAAAWLRELIREGHIADGEVDERSITDVAADDVRGFVQCHFFAGIGGWSYALRLAGWADERPVWTGSCPCQPWSMAGEGKGADDPRHLWPSWFRLIQKCGPAVVFGEQVAGLAGRYWLDLVCADLEAHDYAFGAAVLPAACVGAPHGRSRSWFVAHTDGARLAQRVGERRIQQQAMGTHAGEGAQCVRATGALADAKHAIGRAVCVNREDERDGCDVRRTEAYGKSRSCGEVRGMADADGALASDGAIQRSWRLVQPATDAVAGFWSGADWIYCRDDKYRPVESGSFPLGARLPARVGRLRGYGNAIVPQVAAVFIQAADEAMSGSSEVA